MCDIFTVKTGEEIREELSWQKSILNIKYEDQNSPGKSPIDFSPDFDICVQSPFYKTKYDLFSTTKKAR